MRIGIVEILVILLICLPVLIISLGTIYIARVRRKKAEKRVPCPHCAEMILPDAKVCRFCGKDTNFGP